MSGISDVFSRMIVDWQVSTSLRSNLGTDALDMALRQRDVTGAWYITAIMPRFSLSRGIAVKPNSA